MERSGHRGRVMMGRCYVDLKNKILGCNKDFVVEDG